MLYREVRPGNDSADDEEQHQQIGGDGIPGEPGDRSRFHRSPRLCHWYGVRGGHVQTPLSRRCGIRHRDRQSFAGSGQRADDHPFPRVEYFHHPSGIRAFEWISRCAQGA